jgi:hypothetical protein
MPDLVPSRLAIGCPAGLVGRAEGPPGVIAIPTGLVVLAGGAAVGARLTPADMIALAQHLIWHAEGALAAGDLAAEAAREELAAIVARFQGRA